MVKFAREFVRALAPGISIVGASTRHPNTKVIEFCSGTSLGRAQLLRERLGSANKLLGGKEA